MCEKYEHGRPGNISGYIMTSILDHMTICRMRKACRKPKATDTHSEYVIRIVFHRDNG